MYVCLYAVPVYGGGRSLPKEVRVFSSAPGQPHGYATQPREEIGGCGQTGMRCGLCCCCQACIPVSPGSAVSIKNHNEILRCFAVLSKLMVW